MALSTDLAKQIENYVNSHPECKAKGIQVLEIAGRRTELPVYRLPTSMLRYNIRNGRFAAEYGELTKKIGHELHANDINDVNLIKKLLLEQNEKATNALKEDLRKVGQRNPGVVTRDGYLINGNRRMAVLGELQREKGEEKWAYLEVSILPKSVSQQDVWRIEAGLQFSREQKLDYGPINELLKFREGINSGLTEMQIADSLFGGFTEEDIKEHLKRLDLIDNYLQFVDKPGHYKTAEGLNEHFIDLREFIQKEQKRNTDEFEIAKVVKFAFDLIRHNIPHLELRKISRIVKWEESKNTLLREINENSEISSIVNPKKTPISRVVKSDEPSKHENNEAPTMQVFQNCLDISIAAEQSDKPALLLRRALANLRSVNISAVKANYSEVKTLLEQIDKAVKKIEKEASGK